MALNVPSVAAAFTEPASPVPDVVPLAPPVPRETFVVRYAGRPAVCLALPELPAALGTLSSNMASMSRFNSLNL
mgnify:CR=1 FL=1